MKKPRCRGGCPRIHGVTSTVGDCAIEWIGTNECRYHPYMIKSFANKETAALFAGLRVRRYGTEWVDIARRKLTQIHAAVEVESLRLPPGNRLEKLVGDRIGQWSIRINAQWRICFTWVDGNAHDVEIADYH